MKFIELNKHLKSNIEPLYNIKGDDFFLIKQAITTFKSLLVQDFEEFNFVSLDAEKMKKEQIDEQISTLPMISEHRLVIINNPNQEVTKFLNKYEFSDNSIVVVCVNASGLTKATEVDCASLDKADITKYILNYLAKNKLSITEQALDYLEDATNNNMTRIVNELNKITAYCIDTDIITIDIVTNLVSNSSEYAIYILTNAIDTKNYATYQQILNDLSKSQTQNEIFSYMGKYFKRMQYIALSKNDDELCNILGIKPFAIKMARQHIAKNGVRYYINLYEKYIELDYKIKSGKITAKNALYELIF